MHRIEIPEKRIVKEFPSEVSEMREDQFIFFIGLVLQYLAGSITLGDFKISLTMKLLDVKLNFGFAFMATEERENARGEIFRISELCDSFFEEIIQDGEKVRTFKLNFTKNMIPEIWGRYYGPSDALIDITFCEYRIAHSYYAAYLESNNEDDLNHLIAVLYRPAKPWLWLRKLLSSFDGQVRVPFTSKYNPLHLEARVKEIAKLPMAVRYGIFLFFSGCEQFLAKGSVKVDGKEIDFSIIYQKEDDAEDSPDIGLVGILYSLSETKVFGSIEQTDNQNLYDIMIRLFQVIKQARAMEQKYNSHDPG
ncbi:MAG: hypothetical protein ACOYNC_17485 [Bacteroidales bacterium]